MYQDTNGMSVESRLDYEVQGSRFIGDPAVENAAAEEKVNALLADLTPRQREVAELHGMAGLSFVEVGRLTNTHHTSVIDAWMRVLRNTTGVESPRLQRQRGLYKPHPLPKRVPKVKPPKVYGEPVPGVAKHNASTYNNYKCRCKPCVDDHAADGRRRRAAKKSKLGG